MSSETSTRPSQIFVLLSMAAATVAVMLADHTHPVALLLLSAAVLACGWAAYVFHEALFALVGPPQQAEAPTVDRRGLLEWDKQRVLHAIKELEFDHKMGKINAKDFQELAAPLRLRAVTLMEDLDRIAAAKAPAPSTPGGCPACGTVNDPDAKFCKSCGARQ